MRRRPSSQLTPMTLLPLLLLPFLLTSSLDAQRAVSDISGYWHSEELDQSTISIYAVAEGVWHARIVKSANKESVGKELLSGIRLAPARVEFEGRLMSPKNKMEVDAKVVVLPDGRLRVTGRRLFLKRTYVWTKVALLKQ